jgi:translocation and assembly module TamB
MNLVDRTLADLALAYLKPALPSGADIDVVVQASGYTVLGPAGVEQLHADVATGDGRWQLGGLPPVELKPASLSIDEQGSAGMKIALNLPFASGEIAADALLAPGAVLTDRSLSGELRVDMPDLSWLRLVTTEITRAEGHVAGRLQLGGTPANTQLHGRIALSDGGFALVTPGIVLREVGVRVDTDAAGDLRFDGEASSGDGKLQLSGTASPRADPLKLDLRLRGDDFQTMKTSEARISVSPDLHIALGDSKLAVDGTITVLGDGSVSASGDEVLVGNDPGAQRKRDLRIAADITLKLGDEVRFEGFGLKSRLRGSVEMLEQPGVTTRARGEIRLVDGHYKAYGQDLTVETGKLIFSASPPMR